LWIVMLPADRALVEPTRMKRDLERGNSLIAGREARRRIDEGDGRHNSNERARSVEQARRVRREVPNSWRASDHQGR
jgi:hypothetical protein